MSGLAAAKSWDKDAALGIIQQKKSLDGALMPILHALNDAFGYIDSSIVPIIADELNLSRAEVHGVLTFYHDFRKTKVGRHVVKICRAEACQSMAGRDLESHIKKHLNVELGGTTSDNRITFEAVYCLGLCASAPSMMVNDKLHARMSPEKFNKIALELR